jgi:starch synthase
MKPILRVLFMIAEADPFIKIGGLGEVAGSLPAALHRVGQVQLPGDGQVSGSELEAPVEVDVRLAIPLHGAVQRKNYPLRSLANFRIPYGRGFTRVEALTYEGDGFPIYFISGPLIPVDAPVYSLDSAEDGLKYTFFSLAVLELVKILNWKPDVVHANDWHTAPAVYSLGINRQPGTFFFETSTLLGLHNLPYLGDKAGPGLAAFKLPPDTTTSLPAWARNMPLPLGLLAADHIVAVSPTYAREILTQEFGCGLQGYLKSRAASISGILNGLDVDKWNPQTDPALVRNFGPASLDERLANKLALQAEAGLEVNGDIPLLTLIGRMDQQKGIDIALEALRQQANRSWQAIILGTGNHSLEESACQLEAELPDRVRAVIRYDSALSRRLYSGADAILIPSRYEPCGLVQMIAMRYGCVPIARATGGLKDTIRDFSASAESTGFLFAWDTPTALGATIRRALQLFKDEEEWRAIQLRGMAEDFSWERSAREYLALYKRLVSNRMKVTTAG